MKEHPWKLLAEYLSKNWYSQKSFSILIGKRVSEINELIKWKRNITIAWDIILSNVLWTPQKFWITKQIDYEYEQIQQQVLNDFSTKKQNNEPFDIWNKEKNFDTIYELNDVEIGKYGVENIFQEEKENIFNENQDENNLNSFNIPDPLQEKPNNTEPRPREESSLDLKDILKEPPLQEKTPSLNDVFNLF